MTITSKYNGTCGLCNGTIAIGDQIVWVRGQRVTHADATLCAANRAARAAQPVAPKATVDLASVVAFLVAARDGAHSGKPLKSPKTCFAAPGVGELGLSLAPLTGKNPGAVYVKLNGEYAGKVTADGTVVGIAPALVDALRAITADPAAAGAAFGRLTGRCSFCSTKLDDEGSIEVGYGPKCAKNYGLPHKPRGSAKVTPVLAPAPVADKAAAWAVQADAAYDAQFPVAGPHPTWRDQPAGGDYDGTLDMNEARAVRPDEFVSDDNWTL
jgi:hypothetical protein